MNNDLQMVFVKSVESRNTVLNHVQGTKEEHQQFYAPQLYKLWMLTLAERTLLF